MRLRIGIGMARMSTLCHKSLLFASYIINGNTLNNVAHWSNIPLRVWEYTIGGYQVIKKWLSYREDKLLGRPLTKHEVRYVQEMARRIAAIVLLEPELDENYRSAKAHATHGQPTPKARQRGRSIWEPHRF